MTITGLKSRRKHRLLYHNKILKMTTGDSAHKLYSSRKKNSLPNNRAGFTVSAKLGNAVTRNRVRRQLREIYRLHLPELNRFTAAEGTEEKVARAVEGLKRGRIQVFSGNYTGVNPRNRADTIDLSAGYTENSNSSNPSFCYILKDCITVE